MVGYQAALCSLAKHGLVHEAESLVDALRGKGESLTSLAYHAMVACCEKAGDFDRLLWWFEELRARGHQPDEVRYGMALKACEALGGRWEQAIELLEDMLELVGLRIDPRFVKRVFLLLGREGRGQEALRLVQDLAGRGLRLEPIVYEAVITAFAKQGDKDTALRLLELFSAKGVRLGKAAYTSAIHACLPSKDHEAALGVYYSMSKATEDRPSSVTRAALLEVLAAAEKLDTAEALEVAQAEAEAGREGVATPSHMCNNLIAVYAAHELHRNVIESFRLLWPPATASSVPSRASCNHLLKACTQTGHATLALEVVEVSLLLGLL
jgi:pentatricopeptide repeat protein